MVSFNIHSRLCRQLTGYFVPDVSGDYRFFCQGDDYCEFALSLDEHMDNLTAVSFAYFYTTSYYNTDSQRSAPIPLQAGKRYWSRVRHREFGGGDFVTVAMQVTSPGIELTAAEKTYESLRERQRIVFSTDVVREEQTLTFLNVASGSYFISYDGTWSPESIAFESDSDLDTAVQAISGCYSATVARNTPSPLTTELSISLHCPTDARRDLFQIYTSVDHKLTKAANATGPIDYSVRRTREPSLPMQLHVQWQGYIRLRLLPCTRMQSPLF
jgi:hypothetical protein